jgi:hypothetical protein
MNGELSIEAMKGLVRETGNPLEALADVERARRSLTLLENSRAEADSLSAVDIPSYPDSSTKGFSTTDKPSTADTPSTADDPSTTDSEALPPLSSWDIRRFGAFLGFDAQGFLPKPLFVTLKLRLEVESGRRRPFSIAAGRLPDDVHPVVRTSYEGFIYLLECRWLHTPYEPAPWTHPFAARWCSITEGQAKAARSELHRLNALVQVGKVGLAKLWLPHGVSIRESGRA